MFAAQKASAASMRMNAGLEYSVFHLAGSKKIGFDVAERRRRGDRTRVHSRV
jgi:hypothetical protein